MISFEPITDSDQIDMSVAAYLELLENDVLEAGILNYSPAASYHYGADTNYSKLTQATEELFWHTPPYRTGAGRPSTRLGRRMLHIYHLRQNFAVEQGEDVYCPAAEPTLVQSLWPNMSLVDNVVNGQPLVVTHEDEPVAYVKSVGERTAIGLDDIDEFHIIKGALGSIPQASWPEIINSRSGETSCCKIDAAKLFSMASSPLNQRFRPLRLSSFLIPQSIRQQLKFGNKSKDFTFSDIQQRVADICTDAVEL